MDRRTFIGAHLGLALNPFGRSFLNLVCEGDSITFGRTAAVGHDYPSVLARWLGASCLRSYAMSASTLARDLAAREVMVDLAHRGDANTWNIFTVMAGSNDLAGGADPMELHRTYLRYLERRRDAGYTIVSMTILPRQLGGEVLDFEVRRQAFNTALRAQSGADAFIDSAADPRLSALNQDHYADGAHLTDAGCRVVADLIANRVVAVSPRL